MKVKKIYGIVRLTFSQKLIYNKAMWFDIIGTLAAVLIYYSLWRVVFQSSSDIISFTLGEITTYVVLSKILSMQFSGGINQQFAEWIHDGRIGVELLRPMSLLQTLFGMRLGEFLFFVLLKGSIVLVISAIVLPMALPGSILDLMAFIVCVGMSVGIMFYLEFIVGLCCFFTLGHYGISFTKAAVFSLLSGGLVPLFVFSDGLEKVLSYLPFAGMVSTPLYMLLGKYNISEIGANLALQFFWIVILHYCAVISYRHIIKRAVVQGG